MSSPIFVDTNVPIYAAGRFHRYKEPCISVLRLIAEQPVRFITDAEVFQELLHRYHALRLWNDGRRVFENLGVLMRGRIEPIHHNDVETAALYLDTQPALSARDALHLAVMARAGAKHIVTADQNFGDAQGITRLDPADIDGWR